MQWPTLFRRRTFGYTYRVIVERVPTPTREQFLDVRKIHCNAMVLGECGRYPLCLYYFVRFINNYPAEHRSFCT